MSSNWKVFKKGEHEPVRPDRDIQEWITSSQLTQAHALGRKIFLFLDSKPTIASPRRCLMRNLSLFSISSLKSWRKGWLDVWLDGLWINNLEQLHVPLHSGHQKTLCKYLLIFWLRFISQRWLSHRWIGSGYVINSSVEVFLLLHRFDLCFGGLWVCLIPAHVRAAATSDGGKILPIAAFHLFALLELLFFSRKCVCSPGAWGAWAPKFSPRAKRRNLDHGNKELCSREKK